MPTKLDMAKFAKFCKDMGFIFQSSEIYGGINGFWDYGPLGVELKRNIKEAWWQDMVRNPPPGPDGQEIRMVGLDCSIIMNPNVWVASGHVGGFSDPMVDCLKCKKRFRADKVHFACAVVDNTPHAISVEADNATDAEPLLKEKIAKLDKKKHPVGRALKSAPQLEYHSATALPASWPRPCPAEDCDGTLTEPRAFNLMFESHAGPIASDENKVYLRPETAQGIFANYKNVLDSSRLKLPFGIAQVGKAFRNEINPRNFTFRSREFEQMEIEFFCHPNESRKWYEYWRDLRRQWYSRLGLKSENLVPREQGQEELAHYSVGTTDIEYMFPFSDEPQELEGVAHRGDFDLSAHSSRSGKDLKYFDEEGWNALLQVRLEAFKDDKAKREEEKKKLEKEEKAQFQFVPHVIEPSAGADRFTLAVLCEAYTEDTAPDAKGNPETRIVMKFHPRLAPIKAAIFPLVNKDGMDEEAKKLYRELKPFFNVVYDQSGAIGRRYRRQDEAGTPFCITVDGDTMKDGTVTIRDRDTLKQERIPKSEVRKVLEKALSPV
ncbi:glycyl-trna synthetase : Glycine--tRNA ligase OS=Singulisphaera acidiphila (strain ATCC BAA-1392 / DSM 18658 / VKM B-2454 / MOB10) GN=glyQS PE=3 SV=1: tRNA-synt_2b: HGTP_anticodon [Gemmata massiliana]|uniref:Glycine--tRNA ligase n=1 Tax=Gemmata massiliana TaxID=1210884 RepID=A0A6P2D0X9_9BACT|nr:glycine--tRNA ligase [Gemmata massiliana]VTR93072.1 glycyl-trna synthetase : Glycine--tRNA ligase OS=Singulisphaera acidiphila (strain ATCC BAA-1392 / DSM 18658 / VKM B-2454 / MOB10) GN=glyQS PE=3 SV=1: tRNA-synt_2b: HGTP_anticodon [Gemmata massiliana]